MKSGSARMPHTSDPADETVNMISLHADIAAIRGTPPEEPPEKTDKEERDSETGERDR